MANKSRGKGTGRLSKNMATRGRSSLDATHSQDDTRRNDQINLGTPQRIRHFQKCFGIPHTDEGDQRFRSLCERIFEECPEWATYRLDHIDGRLGGHDPNRVTKKDILKLLDSTDPDDVLKRNTSLRLLSPKDAATEICARFFEVVDRILSRDAGTSFQSMDPTWSRQIQRHADPIFFKRETTYSFMLWLRHELRDRRRHDVEDPEKNALFLRVVREYRERQEVDHDLGARDSSPAVGTETTAKPPAISHQNSLSAHVVHSRNAEIASDQDDEEGEALLPPPKSATEDKAESEDELDLSEPVRKKIKPDPNAESEDEVVLISPQQFHNAVQAKSSDDRTGKKANCVTPGRTDEDAVDALKIAKAKEKAKIELDLEEISIRKEEVALRRRLLDFE